MITIPHNLEVEQSILGALLKDCNHTLCREALDTLDVNAFYSQAHRKLFSKIKQLTDNKITVDLLTITDEFERTNELDGVGGFVYIHQLIKNLPSIANTRAYTDVLQTLATKRGLITFAQALMENAGESEDINELIDTAELGIKTIAKQDSGKQVSHVSDFGEMWLDELDLRVKANGKFSGLATGIIDLDTRLAGFDPEALIVLAGRPSMGKTLIAQHILINVGVTQNLPCTFFSMEMSDKQVYERFVSGLSDVCANKIRTADLADEDWARLIDGMGRLNGSNIYVDSDPRLSVAQIRARIRRQIAQKGKQGLIVIDYLGLMKLPKADRHDLAIADVTSSLKNLAKEIKTPILLLAQANRATDQVGRPSMSNIKDSSAIEADADVVLFVHRDEVANPDTELKGVTELIVAKDRHNDGNGTVYLVKQNGGFKPMDHNAVAEAFHKEEQRKAPAKKSRGYSPKGATDHA